MARSRQEAAEHCGDAATWQQPPRRREPQSLVSREILAVADEIPSPGAPYSVPAAVVEAGPNSGLPSAKESNGATTVRDAGGTAASRSAGLSEGSSG